MSELFLSALILILLTLLHSLSPFLNFCVLLVIASVLSFLLPDANE